MGRSLDSAEAIGVQDIEQITEQQLGRGLRQRTRRDEVQRLKESLAC